MLIEKGMEYQISQEIKGNFNSADQLTVIWQSENIVQFTLGGGKGYGSMPLQHWDYLVKKNGLTKMMNQRSLLKAKNEEKYIG